LEILDAQIKAMAKFIDASKTDPKEIYKLMIGFIGPRPIGWISTVSSKGKFNLAPFSFFNMLSMNPSLLGFCAGLQRDGSKKDSLRNVEQTKCFVHNVVTKELVDPMNQSSAVYPYGVSEFDEVGLTALKSQIVEAPRVKEAQISVECKLKQIVSFGNKPGNSHLVIGEVLAIHINDHGLLESDFLVDAQKLKLVSRLGKTNYMDMGPVYSMTRPQA